MARTVGLAALETRLLYNPYQQAAWEALQARTPAGGRRFRVVSLFAGRRGGKTKCGGKCVADQAAVPNSLIYVAAPTYGKLLDYVWPAVWEFIPQAWIASWNEQRQELILLNGTVIRGRSMEDPDWLRGGGPDLIWMDEIRETTEAAWKAAKPALVDRKGAALITTTTNGFDWVYHTFYKQAIDGVPGYCAIRYKTIDNPAIDPKEIEAARAEAEKSGNLAFFRQEYEADFVTFTGAVYGELVTRQILEHDEDIQKIIPEWPKINPDRSCIAGIDPGADHPFGSVLAVITEAGIVWIGEYLERKKLYAEHVTGLQAMLHRDNPARPWAPYAWAIDKSAKQSSIELAQHNILCTAAENDVVAGIQRVSAWLMQRRMWFIRSRVPKTIDQMLSYRWADNTSPDGQAKKERVVKTGDDLCDPVRYATMTWPELPTPEPNPLGRRLAEFPEEQRWAMARLQRVQRAERGDDEPDEEEMTGLLEPSEEDGPFANW